MTVKQSLLFEVEQSVIRGLKYLRGDLPESGVNLTADKALFLAYTCFNHAAMKTWQIAGHDGELPPIKTKDEVFVDHIQG